MFYLWNETEINLHFINRVLIQKIGNFQVCPHTPEGGLHLKKVRNLLFLQFKPPSGVWGQT